MRNASTAMFFSLALWSFLGTEGALGAEATGWDKYITQEISLHSSEKFIETGASGLAAFAIGLYGAHFHKQGFVTSSVYSLLQSGGVILMAEGLRSYLGTSPVVNVNASFRRTDTIDSARFRYIWQKSMKINDRAEAISDIFMWSGLTAVYLNSGLQEPKSSPTTRSLFLFLAANGAILAGAAGYRLYELNTQERDPRRIASTFSVGVSGTGVAFHWAIGG